MSSNSDLWQHLHRSDANRLLSCQSAMQHSSRKAHLSFLLNHDDMSNSDSDMDTTASRSVPSNRIKHEFSAETPNSIRNPYISKPHPPPTINQTLHSGVYLQTFLSPLLTPPSGRSLNSPAGVHEMPASLQESLLLYQHPPPSRESYDLKASKVTADTSNEQRGVRKKRQRKFMCPTCGFGFYTNSDMQKHVSSVHLLLRPYECSKCDKKFGERSNATKHFKSVHERQKNARCDICFKVFAFRDGLVRHIRLVHHNVRNFHCQVGGCGQSFKQSAHLKKHELVHRRKLRQST